MRPKGKPRGGRDGSLTRYAWALSATWRSGYAAACKAVYTGSIPVVALCGIAGGSAGG